MELDEAIRRRRMVRNYDPTRPVDRAIVEELIESGLHAPSAGFSQGWHFLVLDSEADRAEFWNLARQDEETDTWLTGMQQAPVLVLALSVRDVYLSRYAEQDKGWEDRAESHWPVPYWDIDTGMASMLMLLGAVQRGLGACFFGVPAERTAAVKAHFGIGARVNIVGVISLGYRAPDRKSPSLRRGRRPVADVLSYGRIEKDL